MKRCHALGSAFFPSVPGWMPFQASSSLCCPHSDNRRPKAHRENFATKQPRIPRPLASTLASLSAAAPYRSGTHLPEPTVPIWTIATQRNTAKTLPQGSLASSRPLAGASAALPGSPLSGRAGWTKIEKMPCSRERLLPRRARLDALSSKFQPLLSPSGQSPLKGTPQNFATRQPRIPRPLAGTSASLPGAAPYRSGTHLPEPTVPIRTIATQRDTAKTLPQGSLASSRPLAGTSASLSGAAPYRSGTHLPEPAAPNLTIAAHGTRGKLPQSVVRCFRVYQISGRALQIFQAYL